MSDLKETLRQMVAVLQAERQALAGFDLDGVLAAAADKTKLCGRIDASGTAAFDDECRGLADAARRMNEVNRQVRNLIAANVSTRLDVLTQAPALYRAASPALRIVPPG